MNAENPGYARRALIRWQSILSTALGQNAPLRVRLVLLVGIAMLPPGILAFWQARYSYNTALQTLEENLQQAAQLAAGEQDRLIKASQDLLVSLASQPAILNKQTCKRALQRAINELPQYDNAAVTDADGNLTCAVVANSGPANFADREWFKALKQGKYFVVSTQLQSRLTGQWGVVSGLPLTDNSGRLVGTLSVLIGLSRFEIDRASLRLPDQATVTLLNRQGEPLTGKGAVSNNLPPASAQSTWLSPQLKTFTARGRDGIRRVYALSPVADSPITVVLGVPSSTVLNPLALQFAWGIFTPILMWVLALVMVSFGIERMVLRWLSYLERVTVAYTGGDRDVRPSRVVDASAEIRSLGETFSHMADTIAAREAELRESLQQKDVLVREIHHRVKNNLQIVISLLNLHARRIHDHQAENAFTEVRGRINALAALHRRLYESDLQRVDLKWFLDDICNEIKRSGIARSRDIVLTTQVANEVIGPDVAVPLGLLVTEAVSNAYKHAFEGRMQGRIEVAGGRDDDDYLWLTVSDNGVGVEASNTEISAGLGHSLIEAFVRQLGGELSMEVDGGTILRVRFRYQAPPAI